MARDSASPIFVAIMGAILVVGAAVWWIRLPQAWFAPRSERHRKRLRVGGSATFAVLGALFLLASAAR